jgi:negative regulator of flagellin synthesis FlgM
MVDPVSSRPIGPALPVRSEPFAKAQPVAAPPAVATPMLSQMVADLVGQGPPVDFARVAQLKQAIADGSYAVDPQAIARAILQYNRADA